MAATSIVDMMALIGEARQAIRGAQGNQRSSDVVQELWSELAMVLGGCIAQLEYDMHALGHPQHALDDCYERLSSAVFSYRAAERLAG